MTAEACPVCRAGRARPFQHVERRDYLRCPSCAATFLAPAQRPAPEEERAYYALHRNDPQDARYRRFLARLAGPLLARLDGPSRVLDYGCGPGPALAAMLAEAGHAVALYDPAFRPDASVLIEARYDAVACTETAEHFHRPAEEFDRMGALVRPGGWLAVLTCFQSGDARFAAWHYRRDPTHVVFYRAETLRAVARARGWTCEIPAKDVALMRVPGTM